jgi:hypothetical protein
LLAKKYGRCRMRVLESAGRIKHSKIFKYMLIIASIAKKSFVTRLPTSVSRGHLCPWASCRRCFERGQQLMMMQQQ